MGEWCAAHHQIVVFINQCSVLGAVVDAVHFEWVADPGGARPQHTAEIALEGIRAIEVDAFVAIAS